MLYQPLVAGLGVMIGICFEKCMATRPKGRLRASNSLVFYITQTIPDNLSLGLHGCYKRSQKLTKRSFVEAERIVQNDGLIVALVAVYFTACTVSLEVVDT